jgi:multidrug resistance efflux pump
VELRRAEELYNSKITAQSELDIAKANCGALQQQVEELTALVADCERSFGGMRPEGAADIAQISSEPMRAAIAVQESKLRLTEAELSPLLLRAPMDGLVTAVFHHAGEAVVAGQPIVAIAADKADRIVGYLRHPVSAEPQPGALAEIRTRGGRRVSAKAHVVQIGAQLEPLPVALQSSVKLFGPDLGLPVDISLPVNLVLRPGELVDITILPVAN